MPCKRNCARPFAICAMHARRLTRCRKGSTASARPWPCRSSLPMMLSGFLRRQELRAALRAMANAGQRALLLEDPAFADACLEQPAALSGLHPQHGEGEAKDQGNQDFILVEAVKKRRLETLFAPQLAEIDAMEETIAQANMIADIARNDLQLHSGMEPRAFGEFVKPVETKANAPWLRRSTDFNGKEIVVVIDTGGGPAKVATPDQVRDGLFF